MKVVSYNVNGIRAAMNKGLIDWLSAVDADVVCFQEIKATEDQIDTEALRALDYAHQYYFSAEKKGYSGVAILSKNAPDNVVFGTGIAYMDREGRNLRADFGAFSVMSMYLPSGTNTDRLDYKFTYMDDFLEYAKQLTRDRSKLLVVGDYNICHEAIDIHDPIRNKNVSGFLPEERAWMSRFLESGFVDSFRVFNQDPHHYTWWSYRANARANNKGWRLDYAMASSDLAEHLKRSVILSEAVHSDHCPILTELS
jgi:exodeoxyribonuclease III